MDADRILFLAAVVSFTMIAAVVDVRSRTIPNWLTVPAFFAGVAFHCFRSGWHGLGLSLGGFATGFCILLVLMAVGGGGGGDVKLMGALGAWLGWKAFLAVFVLGTVFVVIGSVIVILLQALKRRPSVEPELSVADAASKKVARPDTRMQITYALPVALATWLVLAWIMISKHDGLFARPEHGVTETKSSQRGAKAADLWEGPLKAAAELTHMKTW